MNILKIEEKPAGMFFKKKRGVHEYLKQKKWKYTRIFSKIRDVLKNQKIIYKNIFKNKTIYMYVFKNFLLD